mgnify:FL=1
MMFDMLEKILTSGLSHYVVYFYFNDKKKNEEFV